MWMLSRSYTVMSSQSQNISCCWQKTPDPADIVPSPSLTTAARLQPSGRVSVPSVSTPPQSTAGRACTTSSQQMSVVPRQQPARPVTARIPPASQRVPVIQPGGRTSYRPSTVDSHRRRPALAGCIIGRLYNFLSPDLSETVK